MQTNVAFLIQNVDFESRINYTDACGTLWMINQEEFDFPFWEFFFNAFYNGIKLAVLCQLPQCWYCRYVQACPTFFSHSLDTFATCRSPPRCSMFPPVWTASPFYAPGFFLSSPFPCTLAYLYDLPTLSPLKLQPILRASSDGTFFIPRIQIIPLFCLP